MTEVWDFKIIQQVRRGFKCTLCWWSDGLAICCESSSSAITDCFLCVRGLAQPETLVIGWKKYQQSKDISFTDSDVTGPTILSSSADTELEHNVDVWLCCLLKVASNCFFSCSTSSPISKTQSWIDDKEKQSFHGHCFLLNIYNASFYVLHWGKMTQWASCRHAHRGLVIPSVTGMFLSAQI